jgi:hypothetical protein
MFNNRQAVVKGLLSHSVISYITPVLPSKWAAVPKLGWVGRFGLHSGDIFGDWKFCLIGESIQFVDKKSVHQLQQILITYGNLIYV